MTLEILLSAYCVLIVFASVAGGRLPSMIRMTHLRTQLLMSFVGGLMLGIALLHILPRAVETLGSPAQAGAATLIGIIGMFLLLRAFHHHDHGFDEASATSDAHHEHHAHETHVHEPGTHDCGHSHAGSQPNRGLAWVGMLFGLWLHTLVDGVALAATSVADAAHGSWLGLAGLGTFLAVALHKPLDAFAITSTMKAGGWSTSHQSLVNFAFALACPAGALTFYFGFSQFSDGALMLGWGLALSAGFFICIALSDLLPEVAFHRHDRGKLTTALLVGIALAVAVENLPGHSHEEHGHAPVVDSAGP